MTPQRAVPRRTVRYGDDGANSSPLRRAIAIQRANGSTKASAAIISSRLVERGSPIASLASRVWTDSQVAVPAGGDAVGRAVAALKIDRSPTGLVTRPSIGLDITILSGKAAATTGCDCAPCNGCPG